MMRPSEVWSQVRGVMERVTTAIVLQMDWRGYEDEVNRARHVRVGPPTTLSTVHCQLSCESREMLNAVKGDLPLMSSQAGHRSAAGLLRPVQRSKDNGRKVSARLALNSDVSSPHREAELELTGGPALPDFKSQSQLQSLPLLSCGTYHSVMPGDTTMCQTELIYERRLAGRQCDVNTLDISGTAQLTLPRQNSIPLPSNRRPFIPRDRFC